MDAVMMMEEQVPEVPGPAPVNDLAVRHRHGVSTLLAQRADLRGVYAFADVVEEAVRWSA
jgi:hypothetical protein